MISRRFVPVAIAAALLVCLSLMGIPFVSQEPLGNFSGKMIYSTGEGDLQFRGSYSLYGLDHAPSTVRLRVIINDEIREIEVDHGTNTFSGRLKFGNVGEGRLQAELTVDGRVVAQGTIDLPPLIPPRVHIIRFSSSSLS
jgi:hypothetical protein